MDTCPWERWLPPYGGETSSRCSGNSGRASPPPPRRPRPASRFSHEVSLLGRRRALGIVRLVVFIVSRTWPGCARRWGGGGSRAPGPAAGRPRRVGGGGSSGSSPPFSAAHRRRAPERGPASPPKAQRRTRRPASPRARLRAQRRRRVRRKSRVKNPYENPTVWSRRPSGTRVRRSSPRSLVGGSGAATTRRFRGSRSGPRPGQLAVPGPAGRRFFVCNSLSKHLTWKLRNRDEVAVAHADLGTDAATPGRQSCGRRKGLGGVHPADGGGSGPAPTARPRGPAARPALSALPIPRRSGPPRPLPGCTASAGGAAAPGPQHPARWGGRRPE